MLPATPPNFKPVGKVRWARLALGPPPFATSRRVTGRRLQGVRYERKVQDHLLTSFPDKYVPSPWLYFSDENGVHWRQPDGLLIDTRGGKIIIVEVKYQHTTDAWWQMRRLYLPILEAIFPTALWDYKMLEVVKWFDGTVGWPEPVRLLAHPLDALTIPGNATGVHIWTP